MDSLIHKLIGVREGPCVSLYLPLNRETGNKDENARLLERAIADAEWRLIGHDLSAKGAAQFLGPARSIIPQLREHGDALSIAMFLSPSFFQVRLLSLYCARSIAIGPRFHISPLLPSALLAMQYYILAVSKHKSRFFEVTDGEIAEKSIEGMPASVDEAWEGMERHEKSLQFHSSGSGEAMFHGQGGAKDTEDTETEVYLHKIAKSIHTAVHEQHAPLVFAGVEELFGHYRALDTSGMLQDEYIRGNPDDLKLEELLERSKPIVEKVMAKHNEELLESYGNLSGTGRTSVDLQTVLDAAHRGKVELLFVAEGTEQWGIYDSASGHLSLHKSQEDGDEGLLGVAAAHTIRHRGRVATLPKEKMPEGGVVAAILRL